MEFEQRDYDVHGSEPRDVSSWLNVYGIHNIPAIRSRLTRLLLMPRIIHLHVIQVYLRECTSAYKVARKQFLQSNKHSELYPSR